LTPGFRNSCSARPPTWLYYCIVPLTNPGQAVDHSELNARNRASGRLIGTASPNVAPQVRVRGNNSSVVASCLSGCFSKPQYVVVSLGGVAWNVPSSSHLLIGNRLMLGSEAQQGLESRHRLLAPIMTKNEFIKISLELMTAHAVMGSEQPLLQVADGAICQRHRGLRPFVQVRSRRLSAGHMTESRCVQSTEAPEAVGV